MSSMRTITVAALDTAEKIRELLEFLANENDDESDFRLEYQILYRAMSPPIQFCFLFVVLIGTIREHGAFAVAA